MKIVVDRDLCESHGQCEYVAAEVFHLDDDGEVHLAATVPEDLRAKVQLAASVCPALAIRIEDES
ncbi:ferredoxin [Amycolatopsis sp. GM8]|uniref:ferredoxin n=1 Tax=Amycolatopsis sp. GM8 TaxID=2896530 RepID=UPI001F45627D|nr:ferredoxin [Amycolatopsis sp. GM8]